MLQTTNQYQMGNPLVMQQKNIKNVGYFDMIHMCFCLTIIGMFILFVSLIEQIFDTYCCYCFKPKTYIVVCLVLWNFETIVGMLIVGYASL